MADDPVYVVQRQRLRAPRFADGTTWMDIATVQVPPRTFTQTILKEAVRQAGISDIAPSDRFRVLDVGAATEYMLREKPQDPEYEVVKLLDGELEQVLA